MNDFYVYEWRRPDGTPFYVGKGRGSRDKSMNMRNAIFLRIVAKIRKSGQEPVVVRVREDLTETEAFELEMALVAKYGRLKKGGTLSNLTDGGEGVSGHAHDEQTRSMMAERRKLRGPQGGGYKGVSVAKSGWTAVIEVGGKNIRIGAFSTQEEAARAYDAAAYEAWGSDCFFNFPDDVGKSPPKGRTKEQAMRLRKPAGQYKGVIFDVRRGKWQPKIRINGRALYPGTFSTPEEAAMAYDRAAIEAWGVGNCYLNFPEIPVPAAA